MALSDTLQTLTSNSSSETITPVDDIYNIVSEVLQEEASKGKTSFSINRKSLEAKGLVSELRGRYSETNINWTTVLQTVRTMLESEGLTVELTPQSVTISW